jgi:F-type H+-transporting ATPase subunit b
LDALGISLGYIIVHALSFGILFVVLRAWVYKPALGLLERRRLAIARGLEDARVAADARANAEREANRIISEAQTQAAEVLREATERAGKVEHEIRAKAEGEAAKARELTLAEMEGERNRMLSEMRGQIAGLVIAVSRQVINESLDEQRQRVLINEFFSGIRSGKVKFLQNADLDGAKTAEITSALPLTGDEQQAIRQEIQARLGGEAAIQFRVDPSIMGGLVIRVGDQVVDGSVSAQLEDLRTRLH